MLSTLYVGIRIHFSRPPVHKISCCKFQNESIKQKMHLDNAKKILVIMVKATNAQL